MRWVSHVARMEAGRKVFTILTGKPTGKKPLERPVVDGRTLLERTFKKIGINTRNLDDSAQVRN